MYAKQPLGYLCLFLISVLFINVFFCKFDSELLCAAASSETETKYDEKSWSAVQEVKAKLERLGEVGDEIKNRESSLTEANVKQLEVRDIGTVTQKLTTSKL